MIKKQDIIKPLHVEIIQHYFAQHMGFCQGNYDFIKDMVSDIWSELLTYLDTDSLQIKDIKMLLSKCEKMIASHINDNSKYMFLFWMRRLAPNNIFGVAPMTVCLYREVMTLAIYKYGGNGDTIVVDNDQVVVPSMVAYADMCHNTDFKIESSLNWPIICRELDLTIKLEAMCYVYVRLTQLYRIGAKGGKLHIVDNMISAIVEAELDKCIKLYDNRLKYANIFSDFGDYFNHSKLKGNQFIILPVLNVNLENSLKTPISLDGKNCTKLEMRPNYMPKLMSVRLLSDFLLRFNDEIEKRHGFGVQDFVTFISAIHTEYVVQRTLTLTGAITYFGRGYTLIRISENQDAVNKVVEDLYSNSLVVSKITRERLYLVAKQFISSNTLERSDIDLWKRISKHLIYRLSDKWMVVDFTQLSGVITGIVSEIAHGGGSSPNERAVHFEQEIETAIIKTYGKKSLWVCRQRIQGLKNIEKEIDASFMLGDILFVIEAKAIYVHPEIDSSEPVWMEKRRRKLKEALKQAKKKAEFIVSEREHLHYPADEGGRKASFPRRVRFICPLVITNFPEYIWNQKDEKFIDNEHTLPRILTIPELVKIASVKKPELKQKPYIIKVVD